MHLYFEKILVRRRGIGRGVDQCRRSLTLLFEQLSIGLGLGKSKTDEQKNSTGIFLFEFEREEKTDHNKNTDE